MVDSSSDHSAEDILVSDKLALDEGASEITFDYNEDEDATFEADEAGDISPHTAETKRKRQLSPEINSFELMFSGKWPRAEN